MDSEQNVDDNRVKFGVAGVFLVGLFVLAVGLGMSFYKKPPSDEIQIISSQSSSPASEIIVHVDGAVVSPGVYHLAVNSRVDDAIQAAGGFASDADQARVNLASKIADGQKLHIFAEGESGSVVAGQVSGESTGYVSINSASESQLDKLPGIGPVTAQKIIASRPYSSPEELLSKKVVSTSVYEKIKDLVSL